MSSTDPETASDDESQTETETESSEKIGPTKKSPTNELLKQAPKKTTKEMIHNALSESKSRKGVSIQAIKKYIAQNFDVDPERINSYIKRAIKLDVEAGNIIQTKGVGASGSFRLAPAKKIPEKPKADKEKPKKTEAKTKIEKAVKKTDSEKIPKKNLAVKTTESKTTKQKENPKKATKEKEVKVNKSVNGTKQAVATERTTKAENKEDMKVVKKKKLVIGSPNAKTSKTDREIKATAKRMAKRKSIGNIIKPPKMKPKKK